jgi:hypothetical protein
MGNIGHRVVRFGDRIVNKQSSVACLWPVAGGLGYLVGKEAVNALPASGSLDSAVLPLPWPQFPLLGLFIAAINAPLNGGS